MGLIRPQLLFFGESPSGIRSFDRAELSRDETIRWIETILTDFDTILILEHLELSLAVISVQLGIPTDDLVYHAVNIQSQKTNEKEVLNQDSKVNLKRLNWPDYMLYQARASRASLSLQLCTLSAHNSRSFYAKTFQGNVR